MCRIRRTLPICAAGRALPAFAFDQALGALPRQARFMVAQPSFCLIFRVIESKNAFQRSALVSAAPALLEACG